MLQSVWTDLRSPTPQRIRRIGSRDEQQDVLVVDRITSALAVLTDDSLRSHATKLGTPRLGVHHALQHDQRQCHNSRHVCIDTIVISVTHINGFVADIRKLA